MKQSPRSDRYRDIDPYKGGASRACLDALMKLVNGSMLAKSRNGPGRMEVGKRASENIMRTPEMYVGRAHSNFVE